GASDLALEEEGDHQRVERERLHQGETDDERREYPVRRVRIAADRFHRRRRRASLPERGAKRRDAETEPGCERDQAPVPSPPAPPPRALAERRVRKHPHPAREQRPAEPLHRVPSPEPPIIPSSPLPLRSRRDGGRSFTSNHPSLTASAM